MSTTPKQPCAPPLNLVPNGTAGSGFPAPLDPSDVPINDANPGFGDLITSLLDGAADNADGFDQAVLDTSAIIDALDTAATAADLELDAILALLDAADTAPAQSALTDYTNTFTTGNAIVADAQALGVPDLLELPLALSATLGTQRAPVATTVDAGTLHLGAAPWKYYVGYFSSFGESTSGISQVEVLNGSPTIFQVQMRDYTTPHGVYHADYTLIVTPVALGKFTAQVGWLVLGTPQLLTVTVDVVP